MNNEIRHTSHIHSKLREPRVANEFTKNINVPLTKYSEKKYNVERLNIYLFHYVVDYKGFF